MEEICKEKKICTGCMACYNICPKEAIIIKEDAKGFKYPSVNKEICINCGLCTKVCATNKLIDKKYNIQQVYAAKHKDISYRLESSSGGMFGELANYVIQQQGCVFGAAFDKDNNVRHIKIEKIEQIKLLQKSKYVQSDVNKTYKEVKNELLKDRYVLYSGTPCQIEGLLKTLTDINLEKLITCDIVCHGVPSPTFFCEYKKMLEKKYKSKISEINFRYKNKNGTQNLFVKFENGKEYIQTCSKDIYYKLFSKNYILRESCFYCKFANMNRIADITLGDFWGIKKTTNNFEDNKGVSLVILNTNKGERIFEHVKEKFELIESNCQSCLQPNLTKATELPKNYNKFWKDYNKKGLQATSRKYIIILYIERIKKKIRKEFYKIFRRDDGKK